MALRQQQKFSGDGFTSHIAGMSKTQLYDILSQMKVLIDQNQKQARKILIDNPLLAKALFQAQIMLGMVQPPQVQGSPQSVLGGYKSIINSTQSLPVQAPLQGQKSSSQPSVLSRQQQLQNTPISISSVSIPPLNYHSQTITSSSSHLPQHAKGFFSGPPGPLSQSSQICNIPQPPHAHSHYSMNQSHLPMVSSQMQPTLQSPGLYHQPFQPSLPHQPRPPMHPFSQLTLQVPQSLGFQPSSVPQHFLSPPLFHSGNLPSSSFPQGQPSLPNMPLPQQLYQVTNTGQVPLFFPKIKGGSLLSPDYRNQAGASMHCGERGPWLSPGLTRLGLPRFQLPAGPVGHPPPRLPLLSPEMEKAVLQQVLMLTPEQMNLLPPEQRSQVLEIQEILR